MSPPQKKQPRRSRVSFLPFPTDVARSRLALCDHVTFVPMPVNKLEVPPLVLKMMVPSR